MAIDAKTLNKISSAIKTLTATGKDITGKARELMTVLYAINQGFITVEKNLNETLEDLTSGKFEKRNLRKYLQSLELADDAIEDILAKRKEIDKLDDRRIANAKTHQKLLDLVYDFEEDRYNLANKTFSVFDDLNMLIVNQRRLLDSTGASLENQADIIQKQLRARGKMANVFAQELISTKEIEDHYATINDVIDNITAKSFKIKGVGTVDANAAIESLRSISDQQIKMIEQEDAIRRKKLVEFAAWSSDKKIDLETGRVFNLEGTELFGAALKSSTDQIMKMDSYYSDLVNQVIKHGDLSKEIQDTLTDTQYIFIKEAAVAKQELAIWKKRLDISEANLKLLAKFRPQLIAAKEAGDGLVKAFDSLVSLVPKSIRTIVGLEDAVDNVKAANDKAIKTFTKSLSKTGSVAGSVEAALGEWSSGISKAFGPLGGVAIVLSGLFMLTKKLGKEHEKLSESYEISLRQAEEIYNANLKLVNSQRNQFLTFEELLEIQKQQVGSYGIVFDMTQQKTQETAIAIGEISKAFGYGIKQAKKLNSAFERLGADDELALQLQREVAFMAEMAGLSPHIISQDLLDSGELLNTYFAGMPKEAARAALQTRRLGLSLKKAADLAQRMLDLEGFMTDMFELAAMGGPDFSKAFEFGITGDLENMTKSVMDSIGSLDRFNQMDFLTRQKISKTLGMTTKELAKGLKVREKLADLGKTEREFVEANLDDFGDIADMDQAAIQRRVAERKSMERLDAAWSKIKNVFVKALLPAVEAFAEMIDSMAPAIDFVVGIFQGMATVVEGLAIGLKALMWPIRKVADIIGWIEAKLFGVDDAVVAVNASFTDMFGGLQGIGKLIGMFVGGMTAFKLFGGTLGKLVSKIPVIGSLLSKLPTGGIMGRIFGEMPNMSTLTKMIPKGGLLGKIFGKAPTDEIQDAVKKVKDATPKGSDKPLGGDLLKKVMKAGKGTKEGTAPKTEGDPAKESKGIVGKIQDVIKNFGKIAKSSFKVITGLIKTAVAEIGEILKDGVKLIKDIVGELGGVVSSIIKVIGDSTKQLMGVAKDVGKSIGSIFKQLVNDLSTMFTKVIKTVMSGVDIVLKSVPKAMTAIENVIEGLGKSLNTLVTQGGNALSKLVQQALNIVDFVVGSINKILPKIFKVVDGVVNGVLNVVSKAVGQLGSILQSMAGNLTSILKTVVKGVFDVGKVAFDGLAKVVKSGSGMLKSVIGDLVSIISGSLKSVGEALGSVIKNVLKSIGEGLSSFSGKSLKGAAALLILSGALFVTSKALQNFADVNWPDVALGLGSLVVLSATAKLLSKGTKDMILGAAAIAVLGAALVPMAYALQMFTAVEWGSIGKAFVSLLTLGAIGALAGIVAPELLFGALAIGVFGAALIPFAYALQMFNDVEWGGIFKGLGALVLFGAVGALLSIVAVPMIIAAGAIAALGVALIPLAYGMDMLTKIEWEKLDGAAGVILTLGGAAAILGVVSPLLLMGSVALALFSAAIIPFVYAVKEISKLDFDSMQSDFGILGSSILALGSSIGILGLMSPAIIAGSIALTTFSVAIMLFSGVMKSALSNTDQMIDSLTQLEKIDGEKIAGLGTALGQFGLGLAGLGVGNVVAGIAEFFGGDPFKKLVQLAEIANPLDIAAKAINMLGESLAQLSDVLETVDLGKLSEFSMLKGIASQVGVGFQMRQEAKTANTGEPSREVTAQNVQIAMPEPPAPESTGQNVGIRESQTGQVQPTPEPVSLDSMLADMGTGGGTKKMEMLLVQLIKVIQGMNERPLVIEFDDGTVRHIRNKTRALNNYR